VEMTETGPEQDHPHFALLAYLAEVASVSQHLPEELVEEELAHGGIEDILTAAALAESMKEEIFLESEDVLENGDDGDVSDVDVDIMTVEDEAGVEEMCPEALEPIVPPSEQIQQEPIPADEVSEDPEQENPSQLSQDVIGCENENTTVPKNISPPPVELQNEVVAEEEPLSYHHMSGADDDWQSLISFSEADDTTADNNFEVETFEGQLPLELAVKDTSQDPVIDAGEILLDCQPSKGQPSPRTTVGINEFGQFVAADIQLFEECIDTDDIPLSNGNSRESLDNTVTLSFPAEQALITSPPKRQLSSLIQSDFVCPLTFLSNFVQVGIKKQKTGPVLPNTTRLDILRKRATRVRSREARHNRKRRDFTTALQPVFDNLPSPNTKVAHLKSTPALIPPSLAVKRLQSPITPAPTKRQRALEDQTPLAKTISPVKQLSVRKEAVSPRKHIVIHPSPVKKTLKPEFSFVFDTKTNNDKAPVEQVAKPTPRFEVYSKIFGPPPQLSKNLVDKDTTATLKLGDPQNSTQLLKAESLRVKSPARKRRFLENDTKTLPKKKMAVELGTPVLGRPVRNGSFAVPSIPVPPQLPPSIQRNNNTKRFTSLGPSVLPSPAQPPPSVIRSALPRPAGGFGSALPVPATRRSTRLPQVAKEVGVAVKGTVANVAITTPLPQQIVPVPEKKILLNGHDAPSVSEKIIVPPVAVESIPHTENVTMERPKGKLGGAQRVTRGAAENKKVYPICLLRMILTLLGGSLHTSHTSLNSTTDFIITEGTQIIN
jgi:hypothetical protein